MKLKQQTKRQLLQNRGEGLTQNIRLSTLINVCNKLSQQYKQQTQINTLQNSQKHHHCRPHLHHHYHHT